MEVKCSLKTVKTISVLNFSYVYNLIIMRFRGEYNEMPKKYKQNLLFKNYYS